MQGRKSPKALYEITCLTHRKMLARAEGRDVTAVKKVHQACHPSCAGHMKDKRIAK